MSKKIKYTIFSAALALSLIGTVLALPDNASAGCRGFYANGSTGEIVACQ